MFPKMISVKGVPVPVDSWEELDELIKHFGSEVCGAVEEQGTEKPVRKARQGSGALQTTDRALLKDFVERESRGILNKDLGKFFGVSGKAIRPALRAWSVKTGLSNTEEAQVFEPFNRPDGRGYKLSPPFLNVAKELLGEQ